MAGGYGRSEPLFLILIVFLAMGWIACLLRAWVKIVIIRKISLDDYLMMGAIVRPSPLSTSRLILILSLALLHGVCRGRLDRCCQGSWHDQIWVDAFGSVYRTSLLVALRNLIRPVDTVEPHVSRHVFATNCCSESAQAHHNRGSRSLLGCDTAAAPDHDIPMPPRLLLLDATVSMGTSWYLP